jgi:putative tricarboxylic transport membrane protein
MRTHIVRSLTTLVLTAICQTAVADEFPSRPVKIVVPYAAGGPSDTGARLVQENMSRGLGKPVIIENRGGGGGLNGTESFLAGELDGHTMLLGGIAPLTIIPWTRKVSYVTERDFVPIGTVWRSAQTLVVRSSLGVKTMAEFVAYAKANSDKVTIGSRDRHRLASWLGAVAARRRHQAHPCAVPLHQRKHAAGAVGGQIDGLFGDASTVAAQVNAGKAIALGVAAPQRSPALPDTPTIAEAGYPGVEAEGWHGFVASSKTPPDHVKRLRDALRAAQSDPIYQDRLKKQGATAGEFGPDALAALIRTDSAKWGAIITSANIKVD